VRALVATLKAPRLLVSHADTRRPLGELAALAVAEGTPFSYVSRGAEAGAGIAPADPSELAGMVLP
jgi:hypothetical protein